MYYNTSNRLYIGVLMAKFYRIAGLTVKMDSFGVTDEQADKYRCEKSEIVDIEIESKRDLISAKHPELTIEMCEYLASGFDFYKKLLNYSGFMLHSSAIVVDGCVYLFTADSGTGKSTHTQLWLNIFGDRAYILNDDKPALRLEDGVWYAYGTPWSGKYDISVNSRIPIAGIAILERGDTNQIERYFGVGAIQALLKQVNRPRLTEYRIKLLELMDKLITQVPVWKLKCNMNPEAAIVSYEAMSGQKFERKNENED